MKYDLRLSNGLSIEVEADLRPEDITTMISRNQLWLTDQYGWKINPAHIVLVRPVKEDDEEDSLVV